MIEPFAAYGFNKAHAASYGHCGYQTAYLKANFPTEFMAALMTAESGDLDTVAEAVTECKHMGIRVLPPDVNESLATFTVVDDQRIRFGLAAIKNLGEQATNTIITERKTHGPFHSLLDFLKRTASRHITKKSLESLIKCGALDSLHPERLQLLDGIDTLLTMAREAGQAKASNQSSLFPEAEPSLNKGIAGIALPQSGPTPKQLMLTWERELHGLYVTAQPLADYAAVLEHTALPLATLH
jgi:DNA polymerase-3 subunit alpha